MSFIHKKKLGEFFTGTDAGFLSRGAGLGSRLRSIRIHEHDCYLCSQNQMPCQVPRPSLPFWMGTLYTQAVTAPSLLVKIDYTVI